MARLHLRFRHFRPSVIDAAKALFDAKPWRPENEAHRIEVAQAFTDAISTAYNVPTARVRVNEFGSRWGYDPATVIVDETDEVQAVDSAAIVLGNWSILTFFCVVREHLVASGIEPIANENPSAWACSLFYSVKPAMFRARAREGRVFGVSARDTYTTESWNVLVREGKADNWTGTLIETPEVSDLPPDSLAGDDDNLPDTDEWDGEGFDEEHPVDVADDSQSEDDVIYDADLVPHDESGTVDFSSAAPDSLESLGIVALRKLSRGRVSGGYSLSKPDLINALRQAGVQA